MPSRSLRVVAFAFVALALTVTSSAAPPPAPADAAGTKAAAPTSGRATRASTGRRRTEQPRLLCAGRELQSLRVRRPVLHASRRLLVLCEEPQRSVGLHRAPSRAEAGHPGADPPLQNSPRAR